MTRPVEATHAVSRRAATICHDAIRNQPEKAGEEYERILKEERRRQVLFGGEPVPTLMRPHFLSFRQAEHLRFVSRVIMDCLEKVIRLYFEVPELRHTISLSEREHQIVSIDPGLERVVYKSRLDSFYSGDHLQFLEFNCDSPAAVAYGDRQADIFKTLYYMPELEKAFQFERINRQQLFLDALLSAYRSFGGKKEKPTILITDWRDVKTIHEFIMMREYFQEHGYPTIIADPREIDLVKGHIYAEGHIIDLVYRRVIIREVLDMEDQVGPFLEACRKRIVPVINPFRSKIVSNKSTLAVLTDLEFARYFSDRERQIIRQHVPWTRNIEDHHVNYKGVQHRLPELLSRCRENFVMKPCDGYGGRGVILGAHVSQAEWDGAIESALKGSMVAQEAVPIPIEKFPVWENDGFALQERYVNLNPFAIAGAYAGCISRVSASPIINVSAGGGMVPTFVIGPQGRGKRL